MRMHAPDPVSSFYRSFRRSLLANTIKLKSKPARSLVLLGLIAVATTALASSTASAGSLQKFFASISRTVGVSFSEPQASSISPRVNAAPNAVSLAPNVPQGSSSSLAVERRGHTATRLPDGRVLIAGGENGSGVLNSTEIFDPAAGTFSLGGNLNSPRVDHSATKLADGRVLIAGGRGDTGSLNSTEIFDPTTGAFASGPAMSVARAGHSATLFADGTVLIAGGDAAGSAEIFDPAAGTFSAVGANMNTARSMHSAALLLDGRVLLVGGKDAGGNDIFSGEIFDPSAGSFSLAGNSLNDEHVRPVLRVLPDGKVQIIGGADHEDMEIYDPAVDSFGAHSHVYPIGDSHPELLQQILDAPTRTALFRLGASSTLLNRTGQTITELLTIMFHEDPHVGTENPHTFSVQADANGNFVNQQYAPEDQDNGLTYILAATGGTSGWTAQTALTDAVNVTAATGGTNISADLAVNGATPSATTPLGNIVITEVANGDFPTATGKTLILTAPSGWQFNAGVGSATFNKVSGSGGPEGLINSTTVTATTITVNYDITNTSQINNITISGIQVQATEGGSIPASGNILRTSGNPGTATITGVTNGTTNFGSLSQAVGALRLYVVLPGQTFTDAATLAASGITGTPTAQTAGTSFNITNLVAADRQFNIDSTYTGTKTIAYSGPGNSPSGASPTYTTSVAFTAGQSTTTLATTLPKAETTTISATSATAPAISTGVASSSLTVNPGAIANYTVSGSSPQVAGTAFNVTVTARDSLNNTVTTDSTTSVTMTGTGSVQFDGNGNSTFGEVGDNIKTLSSGTFTISAKDSVPETITITATDGNGKTGTSSPILVAGPLDHFAVTTPGTQTAGTAFAITTITAQDANNNTVTTFTGTVDMSETGGGAGGTVTPSQSSAFTAGVLSGQSVTLTKSGSLVTITVTDHAGTGKTGVSGTFTVNPGTANKLAFGQQPTDTTAGVAISPAVTVIVQDQNGNTVTGSSASVTVGSANTAFTGSTLTVAASSGMATFSAIKPTTAGTSRTLTASSTGLTGATSSGFTVSAATANAYRITAASTTPAAGANDQLTITQVDQFGNTVTSFSGDATLTFSGLGTSLAGNLPTVTDKNGTAVNEGTSELITFTNGVSSAGGILAARKAETATLNVTDGSISSTSTGGAGVSLTVSATTANAYRITAASTTPTVGVNDQLTITLVDQFGNTVTTFSGDKTLTFSGLSTSPSGAVPTVTNKSGTAVNEGTSELITFTNGVRSAGGILVAKTAETATLNVSDSATLSSTSTGGTGVSLTVSAATATKLAFGQQPTTTTAGVAISPAVTVIVQDQFSNTITGSSASVTIGSANTAFTASTLTVAASSGVATFSAIMPTTAGASRTLTASSSGLTGATSSGFTVNATTANAYRITAASTTPTAGANDQLTLTLVDQFANTVSTFSGDKTLTFSGLSNSPTGAMPTVTDKTGAAVNEGTSELITFTNGVRSAGGILVAKAAETATLNVSDSGGLASTSTGGSGVSLTVSGAAASAISFVQGPPATVLVGQTFSPAVTVLVTDAFGNPKSGTSVTMSLNGGGTLSGGGAQTTAAGTGIATFSALSVNQNGTGKSLTATDGAAGSVTSSTFTVFGLNGPTLLGTQATGNSTASSLAQTGVTVATGNTIFVTIAMDAVASTVTVTDNGSGGSNTYTNDADATNGSGTNGVRTLVFSAPVTHALSSGTITINVSSSVNIAASFFSFNGLVSPSPKDQFHTAIATSSAPNSGATATTTQVDEVLIGAMGLEDRNATITAGSPFINLTASSAGGGQSSNSLLMQPEYRIVSATSAYTASGSSSSSMPWAADIVTYKIVTPTVSIVRVDASPVDNGTTVHFTITFSENVFGVDASDFALAQSGVTGSTFDAFSGSGTTYSATVTVGTGAGTVGLNLVDNDSVFNIYGISMGGTGAGNGNVTGQTYTTPTCGMTVTTNPSDTTVCASGTATFTAAANGTPAPTVQWQVSTNGGVSFSDIPGATSTTYSFTTATADNGKKYQAIFSNTCPSVTTTAATLTVTTAPSVTTSPVDTTVCAGALASFTAAASGSPAPTVQWQVSADGGLNFADIGGATTTTLSFTTTAGQNGNKYRARFSNTCGSNVATTAATLTVNTAPSVTTNPSSTTVCAGALASFTAAASGSPTPTVQWQVSTNGGVSFSDIGGATSTTLSFTATAADNAKQYRARFTNTCGSNVTTTAGTLTVNSAPAISVQPTNQAATEGATATFSVTSNGTGFQWRKNGNTIVGATSSSYTTPALQLSDSGGSCDCNCDSPDMQ